MTRENVLEYLHKFNQKYQESGFRLVSLFGSYARGDEDIFSDIDIVYTIDHEKFYKDDAFAKLRKIADFKQELEMQLNKKVDLVPLKGVNKFLQKNLEKEQIAI